MPIHCVLSLCACILLAACAGGGDAPESAPPDPSPSAAESFVGTWQLVSWTRTTEEGQTTHPYGEDAFGRTFYTSNGKMAAILMRRDREKLSTSRAVEYAAEDFGEVAQGYFSYSGTYTVDQEEAAVTHHVEACTNPNWTGGDRVREFELRGENRIVLRPRGSEDEVKLVWVREE